MADRLPTGDSIATTRLRYRFYIPNSDWLIEAFFGEVLDAVQSTKWEQEGAVTPDEASYAFLETWLSIMPDFMQIGVIIPFAGATSPSDALIVCDGRELAIVDYPELFAVIGFTYSSHEGDNFRIPDLQGRAIMGVGTGSGLSSRTLGQSLGEESHVLSVGELATHNHSTVPHAHTEITAIATVINGGIEAPAPSALPSVGSTGVAGVDIGYSGGSDAHNNVQPVLVCNYLIVAK